MELRSPATRHDKATAGLNVPKADGVSYRGEILMPTGSDTALDKLLKE